MTGTARGKMAAASGSPSTRFEVIYNKRKKYITKNQDKKNKNKRKIEKKTWSRRNCGNKSGRLAPKQKMNLSNI